MGRLTGITISGRGPAMGLGREPRRRSQYIQYDNTSISKYDNPPHTHTGRTKLSCTDTKLTLRELVGGREGRVGEIRANRVRIVPSLRRDHWFPPRRRRRRRRGAHSALLSMPRYGPKWAARQRGASERRRGTRSTFPRRAPLIIHRYVNGNARHGHHWAVPRRRCLSMRACVTAYPRSAHTIRETGEIPRRRQITRRNNGDGNEKNNGGRNGNENATRWKDTERDTS